jgi:hypothetical protein
MANSVATKLSASVANWAISLAISIAEKNEIPRRSRTEPAIFVVPMMVPSGSIYFPFLGRRGLLSLLSSPPENTARSPLPH